MYHTNLQSERTRHWGKSLIMFWIRFIASALFQKRFNKSIYTRILFFNVILFVVSLALMLSLSGFIVGQVTNAQLQQDLLRKAKRVNYALQQLAGVPSDITESARLQLEAAAQSWKKAQILYRIRAISKLEYDRAKAAYIKATEELLSSQNQAQQEHLKFLADLFNAEKITLFDKTGKVIGAFAKQEAALNSRVASDFVEALNRGEIEINRVVDRRTKRVTFNAVVPVKNQQNIIENGILLEMKLSGLGINLNRMFLYSIIMGMVILVIVIFISIYLGMSISRPIFHLATNVAEISQGNANLDFEDQPLEEIKVLIGQLNKLAVRYQKIQTESSKMEEERARLFMEISHELRTPLTSIKGFVEAIRDGMVQDKALMKRYLDTIYTQTVHITRLVDDILALGRLESGTIAIEKQPLDLAVLLQNVVMSFEAEAKRRNILLHLEKATEEAIVIGDIDRMEQIVRNLLKNALAATENGAILVSLAANQGVAVVVIQDNGIGIAAEDLPHIWDRFYRVKNQLGSQMIEKGTGLGLVIVKKLVELQGGTINVESLIGKGTTFKICFPLSIEEK